MDLNGINNQIKETYSQHQNSQYTHKKESKEELSLDETLNQSAVEVSISMNAQIVLMELESYDKNKGNILTQATISEEKQDILNFLSGKEAENGLSLEDIGYEGKPILDLTPDEAKELISEDGFFGITNTSDRVANFVFSFAGDNVELIEKGIEGIIQGFEEAERLFGGELPEISYETQERTLNLLNERIASLQNKEN